MTALAAAVPAVGIAVASAVAVAGWQLEKDTRGWARWTGRTLVTFAVAGALLLAMVLAFILAGGAA